MTPRVNTAEEFAQAVADLLAEHCTHPPFPGNWTKALTLVAESLETSREVSRANLHDDCYTTTAYEKLQAERDNLNTDRKRAEDEEVLATARAERLEYEVADLKARLAELVA